MKNDTSLICANAKRSSQCPLDDVSMLGNCVWVSLGEGVGNCEAVVNACDVIGTNRNMCETPGAAVSTDTLTCFWLYDTPDKDTGTCREKQDETLECSEAKKALQCTEMTIDKFGDNCFWLQANTTRDPSFEAQCVNKVW
jgi:hypothetical protein